MSEYFSYKQKTKGDLDVKKAQAALALQKQFLTFAFFCW
jgi:hypothetical protein